MVRIVLVQTAQSGPFTATAAADGRRATPPRSRRRANELGGVPLSTAGAQNNPRMPEARMGFL